MSQIPLKTSAFTAIGWAEPLLITALQQLASTGSNCWMLYWLIHQLKTKEWSQVSPLCFSWLILIDQRPNLDVWMRKSDKISTLFSEIVQHFTNLLSTQFFTNSSSRRLEDFVDRCGSFVKDFVGVISTLEISSLTVAAPDVNGARRKSIQSLESEALCLLSNKVIVLLQPTFCCPQSKQFVQFGLWGSCNCQRDAFVAKKNNYYDKIVSSWVTLSRQNKFLSIVFIFVHLNNNNREWFSNHIPGMMWKHFNIFEVTPQLLHTLMKSVFTIFTPWTLCDKRWVLPNDPFKVYELKLWCRLRLCVSFQGVSGFMLWK